MSFWSTARRVSRVRDGRLIERAAREVNHLVAEEAPSSANLDLGVPADMLPRMLEHVKGQHEPILAVHSGRQKVDAADFTDALPVQPDFTAADESTRGGGRDVQGEFVSVELPDAAEDENQDRQGRDGGRGDDTKAELGPFEGAGHIEASRAKPMLRMRSAQDAENALC